MMVLVEDLIGGGAVVPQYRPTFVLPSASKIWEGRKGNNNE